MVARTPWKRFSQPCGVRTGGAPGPSLSEKALGPAPVRMIGSGSIVQGPVRKSSLVPTRIWVYAPPRSPGRVSLGRNRPRYRPATRPGTVSYTHLRAHETRHDLV